MLKRLAALVFGACFAATTAAAEVKAKAPDGLTIQIVAEVALDRDDAWARLLDLPAWWNGAHSYSGDAKMLSLDAQAGGCWCEIWNGGEVEHGRVVMVMPRQLLRVDAALGPLQEMGVAAALTVTLSDGAAAGRTKLVVDYKVAGSSLSGLDKIAPAIDQVLSEQFSRFAAVK